MYVWLWKLKENSRKLLKKILTSENIPWAGYREGAELTIILLSGGPPEVSTRAIALHEKLFASQHEGEIMCSL